MQMDRTFLNSQLTARIHPRDVVQTNHAEGFTLIFYYVDDPLTFQAIFQTQREAQLAF